MIRSGLADRQARRIVPVQPLFCQARALESKRAKTLIDAIRSCSSHEQVLGAPNSHARMVFQSHRARWCGAIRPSGQPDGVSNWRAVEEQSKAESCYQGQIGVTDDTFDPFNSRGNRILRHSPCAKQRNAGGAGCVPCQREALLRTSDSGRGYSAFLPSAE
jgi:hypothetical protein